MLLNLFYYLDIIVVGGIMDKIIYNVLKTLENNNYESYIVGGYVRDMLLGNISMDIDITTKARPKEVLELFKEYDVKIHEYGNVSFDISGYKFDITTFRKDIKYKKSRKPEKIVYIDSFEEDLKRRDFTINSICLDLDENIIDLYDGRKDLKRKLVRSIGDPNRKLEEDALRILRAVRFASVMKFRLDDELKRAIIDNRELIRDLSFERKKEELNKIFCSKHKKYGVKLLRDLKLLDVLDLKDIEYVLRTNDLIGMWAMITDKDYAFTKKEKDLIKKIRIVMNEDINDIFVQYKYGSYPISVVSDLKGYNTKKIMSKYDKIPIKDREEISINVEEICSVLGKAPDSFLGNIFEDIEHKILDGSLVNDKGVLKEYISSNY